MNPKRFNLLRRCRAFTLLEVIVSVSIAAVIVGLALPYFGDTRTARIAHAFEGLHSHILLAQSASLANPTAPASLHLVSSGYSIEGLPHPLSIDFNGAGSTEAVNLEWEGLSDPQLTFNHYGALAMDPDAPDPVLRLTIPGCPSALEVTLRASSGSIQGEWVSVN